MNLHLPTLLFACTATLLLITAVMAWFGWREKSCRGHWWWVAAQGLLATGLALEWFSSPKEPLGLLAQALILQWPICVLTGMRRFYSRHGIGIPGILDACTLAVACLAVPATLALNAPAAVQDWAWLGAPLLVQTYAAALITRLSEFRGSAALQLLVISLVAAGLAGLAPSIGVAEGAASPMLAVGQGGLLMMPAAVVLLHAAMMLSFRRTEHTWLATQRKLQYLADMDVLTRVANRRHFHELAAQTLPTIKIEEASVLMFDIDHFRRINDMFGHASGDDALRQVAHCMRDTLREQDIAGRLGGDQFAILLPGTVPKGAMAVAARIVANLVSHQVAPRIAPLSLSFGVVVLYEGEAIAEALRRAEQALHEAKRQGRSRVVVATGSGEKPIFTNSRTLGLISA